VVSVLESLFHEERGTDLWLEFFNTIGHERTSSSAAAVSATIEMTARVPAQVAARTARKATA
jgi:hypothetical protein